MAELEKLVARIEGDVSGLRAALQQATKLSEDAGKKIEKGLAPTVSAFLTAQRSVDLLKAAVGAWAVKEAVHGAHAAIEFGASLKDMAAQTGLSTDALQELRYAGSQLGVSVESMDAALTRLAVNLGQARAQGGEAGKAFRELGIDVRTVGTNEQALEAVVGGLNKIQDPAERSARAFELLGREAGPRFQQFIAASADEVRRLRDEAHKLGAVVDGDIVEKAAKANDELASLSIILKAEMTDALVNLAPLLIATAKLIGELGGKVNEVGEGIGIFFGKLAGGSVIPFDSKIEKATDTLNELTDQLESVQQILQQQGQGVNPVLVQEAQDLSDRIVAARAELDRLVKLQQDYFDLSKKSGTVITAPKPPPAKIPKDILDQQRKLLASIEDENLHSAQQVERQWVDAYFDMADGVQVSYKEALGYLGDYTANALKLEQSRYDQEVRDFEKQAKTLEFSKVQHDAALVKLEATHEANKTAIVADGELERQRVRQKFLDDEVYSHFSAIGAQKDQISGLVEWDTSSNRQRYDSAVKTVDGILAANAQTSKKAFELHKKFAIAEAVASTAQAAIGAAADTKGPWYVRVAAAAAALAFGYAQVRAIQASEYGGGGSSHAGATARPAISSGDEGSAAGGSAGQNVFIHGINPNDLFSGRQLIDLINQAMGDGARVQVVS